ncbi:MAG: helix-turn-helix transcriptional regulator [Formivibrio sp.]|nr:helix-turn-helix transcriptional regulator [Formivibrio sp.]
MANPKHRTSDGLAILDSITGEDPAIHALIVDEAEKLRIAKAIFQLRTKAGLSQTALAKRIGTTRVVISKLEDADYAGNSPEMLQRIGKSCQGQRL